MKGTAAAAVAAAALSTGPSRAARAQGPPGEAVGTLIDLTRCDGCAGREIPACVAACRAENADRFPEPIEGIPDYWPQQKHEDWSERREIIDRLTPYNWLAVQKIEVDGETVSIPRRCMHCDDPACVNLCPFGASEKLPTGAVVINEDLCFGGAKCRDVCPWGIRQRQAGVGIYLKVAPQYVGGGVMYACDLCSQRLEEGRAPACVEACPRGAMEVGPKETMRQQAHRRAAEIGGYVYGDKEAGGTSTFYVSKVPFARIDAELKARGLTPGMEPGVGTVLDTLAGKAVATAVAPIAGAVAAGYAAYEKLRGKDKGE